MASKLGIYNDVLLSIGIMHLRSLNENRNERGVIDTVWDDAVNQCLKMGMWDFAARDVELDSAASIEPAFGYTYAYTKPNDWIRTMGQWADERQKAPLLEILDAQAYWWANIQPVYIRYVSNDPDYGFNVGKWTGSFPRLVAANIIVRVAPRLVAGAGGTLSAAAFQLMQKNEERFLRMTENEDMADQPTQFPAPGSWVRSRYYGPTLNGTKRGLP